MGSPNLSQAETGAFTARSAGYCTTDRGIQQACRSDADAGASIGGRDEEDLMHPWMWILIAAVVIIAVIAAGSFVAGRNRTRALRRRFGPGYERAVGSAPQRQTAEAELEDRTRRHARLTIRPLPGPVRRRYADEWRALQEQFVDRPSEAVTAAEGLLTRVMADRGYPVSSIAEQAELVSVDHPDLVGDYRIAHEIHERNQLSLASTEDLREALLRYRAMFDGLLRPEGPPLDGPHPEGRHTQLTTSSEADLRARTEQR
jgi:hypothetical protein